MIDYVYVLLICIIAMLVLSAIAMISLKVEMAILNNYSDDLARFLANVAELKSMSDDEVNGINLNEFMLRITRKELIKLNASDTDILFYDKVLRKMQGSLKVSKAIQPIGTFLAVVNMGISVGLILLQLR